MQHKEPIIICAGKEHADRRRKPSDREMISSVWADCTVTDWGWAHVRLGSKEVD